MKTPRLNSNYDRAQYEAFGRYQEALYEVQRAGADRRDVEEVAIKLAEAYGECERLGMTRDEANDSMFVSEYAQSITGLQFVFATREHGEPEPSDTFGGASLLSTPESSAIVTFHDHYSKSDRLLLEHVRRVIGLEIIETVTRVLNRFKARGVR